MTEKPTWIWNRKCKVKPYQTMEFFGGGDDLVQLMNHWFKHAVRTRGGTGRRMDK